MSAAIQLALNTLAWEAGLTAAYHRQADLRPPLRSIARAGVSSTRRRFQLGRGPDGSTWTKSKKRNGQTGILSGLLLRSIADRAPKADSVEWGSTRSYAAAFQFGLNFTVQVSAHTRVVRKIFGRPTPKPVTQSVSAHARKMDQPARPYLGVSPEDGVNFTMILLRHVAQPLVGGPGA